MTSGALVQLNLTVVGSINADLTAVTQRLPGPGETVGGGRLVRDAGGKGANQAAAAARLGARTRMIGAVGDDDEGRAMLAALTDAGVDTKGVAVVEAPTGTALIVLDADGENQIAVCEGANAHVSVAGQTFDDDALLLQLEIAMETVTTAALASRGFVALNAAPARSLPDELVERCDLIIVNETEYELIPALRGARRVAVTYGSRGSVLLEHGDRVAVAPAPRVTTVNSVGAGDAFCAALTLALCSGVSPEASLAAANAVGAATVADASSRPRLSPLAHYLP